MNTTINIPEYKKLKNWIILFGIILSAFNTLTRADYNLPIFVLAFLAWDMEGQKVRISYLLIFTLLIDVIWLIFWFDTKTIVNQKVASSSELSTYEIVWYFSIVVLLLKILLMITGIKNDKDIEKALIWDEFKRQAVEAAEGGEVKETVVKDRFYDPKFMSEYCKH